MNWKWQKRDLQFSEATIREKLKILSKTNLKLNKIELNMTKKRRDIDLVLSMSPKLF